MGTSYHRPLLDSLDETEGSLEEKRKKIEKMIIENGTNGTRINKEQLEKIERLLEYEFKCSPTKNIDWLFQNNPSKIEGIDYPNKEIIEIIEDITSLQVDAIVNPVDEKGLGCCSFGCNCLDNKIHRKCGPRLRYECDSILKGKVLETGEVFITNAYHMPCKYIIHCLGPRYSSSRETVKDLYSCYHNILDLAKSKKIYSIALPTLSIGPFGYPLNKATEIMRESVLDWCSKNNYAMKIMMIREDEHFGKILR